MSIPRPEYPRPQFTRRDWMNLNGEWAFAYDPGDSGFERGLVQADDLPLRIRVPFCMESRLSGLGHTDFMAAVWYRRTVSLPGDWAGRDLLLHFGAADYDTTVWVNGQVAGRHRGGHSSFSFPIGDLVEGRDSATVVVRVRDLPGDHPQPRGKQSPRYGNYGCVYTRTTGIWQTVWLEPVPRIRLERPRIQPNLANHAFDLVLPVTGRPDGGRVRVALLAGDQVIAEEECPLGHDFSPQVSLPVPEAHRRLWSPDDPFLYDLSYELYDAQGVCIDTAAGYAGLRGIALRGRQVLLNGEPLFQRLVLDQGYYPDGLLTAPDDAALARDIELSQAAGFNGARLHQKIFEERFLYHADRRGYLVWGEFPDWGAKPFGAPGHQLRFPIAFASEWLEVLHRDLSHPSIIGWCALNETGQSVGDRITDLDDATRALFLAAKAIDPTRPVLDASGWSHRVPESDVYDIHDYEQDPEQFRRNHERVKENRPHVYPPARENPMSIPHQGQPFFVSEFGGAWWNPEATGGEEESWGYGDRPRTESEFLERFEKLVSILLDDPLHFGYCYTQLTDVFQEQNGLYHFDRRPKFDPAILQRIQSRPAAMETTGNSMD